LWVQSKWEDLVLKFLIKTIEEVNDDEWNIQLGEEMCNQFALYANYPKSKSMLFKCIGVVLQRSGKKSFVRDKLDYMFNVVDHNKVEDRTVRFFGFFVGRDLKFHLFFFLFFFLILGMCHWLWLLCFRSPRYCA